MASDSPVHSLIVFYRNHSAHFENAKAAFEEGGGNDELEDENALPGPSTTIVRRFSEKGEISEERDEHMDSMSVHDEKRSLENASHV